MDPIRIRVLSPIFLKNFKCLCSSCEDNCCVCWNINIDYDTYKKYQYEQDKAFKELFQTYILLSGDPVGRDDYAKIVMNKNNVCPFLTEDKHCHIQLCKGAEAQAKICRTFPRIHHVIDGILEESVSLACPEAARLALLNPSGINFYIHEEVLDSSFYVRKVINTQDPVFTALPAKYFLKLRTFSIKVIKDRRYSLWERLIYLGKFFQEMDFYIGSAKLDQLPELMDDYLRQLSYIENIKELCNSFVSCNKPVIILFQILISLSFNTFINSQYSEILSHVLKGFGVISFEKNDTLLQSYANALQKYYLPYITDRDYILENYMVNHIFKIYFPFSAGLQSLFEKYTKLILQYSLIKIQLIGLSAFYKDMSDDWIVKLVQCFTKEIDHNSHLFEKLYDFFNQTANTTLNDLAELIKN